MMSRNLASLSALSADKFAPVNIIAIPQMTFATASLIASSTMAIITVRAEKGLTTPFRRIIFGLSVADIFQSVATLVGPIAVTRNTPDSWGLGNDATCRTAGFLLTVGSTAVPKYTCFICWYYLCKLKYRMANDAFARRSEWKIHLFIILDSIVIAFLALAWDLFHPAYTKTHCQMAVVPLYCRFFPDEVGKCESAIASHAKLLGSVEYASSYLLCLIGMIVMMIMLLCHAYAFTKNFDQLTESQSQNSNHERSMEIEIEDIDDIISIHNYTLPDDGENTSNPQEKLRKLSKLYRVEAVLQAACYIGSFCFVYLPLAISIWFYKLGLPPKPLQAFPLIVYPIGGFLNVLVYTRPQVASLQREYPAKSRVECLWLVLRAGGELPKIQQQDETDGPRAAMVDPSFSLPPDFETIETPPFVLSQRISSNDLLPSNKKKAKSSEREQNTGDNRKSSSATASTPKQRLRRFYQMPSSFISRDSSCDKSRKENSEKEQNTGDASKILSPVNAPNPERRFYQMPSSFLSQDSSLDASSTLESGARSTCLSYTGKRLIDDDEHRTNVKSSPNNSNEGVIKEENSTKQYSFAHLSNRSTSSTPAAMKNQRKEKPKQRFYQWPPPILSSIRSHDSIWSRLSSNNASNAVSSSALSYGDEETIPDTNKFRT